MCEARREGTQEGCIALEGGKEGCIAVEGGKEGCVALAVATRLEGVRRDCFLSLFPLSRSHITSCSFGFCAGLQGLIT